MLVVLYFHGECDDAREQNFMERSEFALHRTFHSTRMEQLWNRSRSQKDLRPELSPVEPSSRKIYAPMTEHEESEDEGAGEIRENCQSEDCQTQ